MRKLKQLIKNITWLMRHDIASITEIKKTIQTTTKRGYKPTSDEIRALMNK